jgi:protein TonB
MMNSQLKTPARIPKEMKTGQVQDAPPPSGVAGMEGLAGNGNGVGNLFKGQTGPKVKAEKVNISAGVAIGLLIQKTAPVYPPIAKSARVSGTVVLGASISKNGSIVGLHVVSGPPMLQQAALDAVRTWRYRPYMLNNQPVEVETTVSVIFTLDH